MQDLKQKTQQRFQWAKTLSRFSLDIYPHFLSKQFFSQMGKSVLRKGGEIHSKGYPARKKKGQSNLSIKETPRKITATAVLSGSWCITSKRCKGI